MPIAGGGPVVVGANLIIIGCTAEVSVGAGVVVVVDTGVGEGLTFCVGVGDEVQDIARMDNIMTRARIITPLLSSFCLNR
jgi:hypothetical protein